MSLALTDLFRLHLILSSKVLQVVFVDLVYNSGTQARGNPITVLPSGRLVIRPR
jgi:hypothetical protein